ncbi:MAG: phosphotransferase, partial [Nanoarchaeota archaeon]
TKLAENIGINISYMHKVLLDFDANGFPQNFADSFDLGSMSNEYFKYISAVLDELYKYDLRNLRKSVIHGDICRENLIIKDNQLKAILDFDDAHTNYLIWDVATAISQLFITKTSKIDWAGIRNFFKGYNLWMTLNFTEAKVIITLLKLVNLRLAILADSHLITKESSEWKSIKSSVLTKLKLIEKNGKKLSELILEVSR